MIRRPRLRSHIVAAALTIGCSVMASGAGSVAHAEGTTECAAGTATKDLNEFFSRQVADLVGFDSVRVYPLVDGRSLWLAQDAYLTTTPGASARSLRPPVGFAHNVAIVQEGNCFTTVHGPITPGRHCEVADASFVGRDITGSCSRWFWPMGGAINPQGQLAVFFAEMVNPRGTGAAPGAATVGVWLATIDTATFQVLSFAPAPAAQGDIAYGYGVESDETFTYLFGYSHDQFNRPDPSSPPPSQVFVARVPRGRFDLAPDYWNGATWTPDRAAAVPINDGFGGANPMQPRRLDGTWVSVVRVDDWLGSAVRVAIAGQPQGPWTTVQELVAPTRTADGQTNTYAAHLLPWRSTTGNLMVAMSNNAWTMDPVAFNNPALYRPTFFELAPTFGLQRGAPVATLSAPAGFVTVTPPTRDFDSRSTRRLEARTIQRIDLASHVAADASAAALNLTMVSPAADGYVTAWPCDQPQPATSNVNAARGMTRAAHAVVDLSADRAICVYAHVATNLVVDVNGWYVPSPSAGLGFHPIEAQRIVDTRSPSRRFAAGEMRRIPVPAGASAIAANITVTDPQSAGFVTVYPCGTRLPTVSSVNVAAGETAANLVQVGVAGGEVCVYSYMRTHVVIDLVGTYDTAADGLRYQSVAPTRVADTRTGVGTVQGMIAFDGRGFGVFAAQAPVALPMVPPNVRAVMTSMVVISTRDAGWGVISSCRDDVARAPSSTSTLNYSVGGVVANQSIVPTMTTSGREVCTFATSPAYHVVDLVGWFV
jgi:hypothetical protein